MITHEVNERLYEPAELVAELDSLHRDQAALRQRAKALHAKLVGLRANSAQCFDGYDREAGEFVASSVYIEYAGRNLGAWIRGSVQGQAWLALADDCAGKIRKAPRTEQAASVLESGNAIAHAMARSVDRDGVDR
ncbi:hypothetical protein [Nocardia sp. NPDC050717]|uniref:hypothetical protein n=1 Tax=Nocardia sp. NPDC050717 TaxID=3157221 RepID=UPI0033FC8093